MFRKFRILVLLLILLVVAHGAWRAKVRITSWKNTVYVALFPIAADTTPETAQFIGALKVGDFAPIETWLQQEARRYGSSLESPVRILLAPEVRKQPPAQPIRNSMPSVILWSLKLRWWAFWNDKTGDNFIRNPQVRLFVLFHAAAPGKTLPHSTGLEKGGIGIVHVFAHAEQRGQNAVVIAHELLHTFGASDKYNPVTLQPEYPDGYANPDQRPPLPQTEAEIMAGRIPLRSDTAEIPLNLTQTRIGNATAVEIGLVPAPK